MRTFTQPKYLLATLLISGLVFLSIAWTGNRQINSTQTYQDTVPQKNKATEKVYKKDFDKQLDELDKALKNLEKMPNIDGEKLRAEIEEAMKKVTLDMAKHQVNMEKLQKELKESLANINTEKMQAELKASLRELEKVDANKIQAEIRESLKEVEKIDMSKIQAEIKESMKQLEKVDMTKMRMEIEKAMEEVKTKLNQEDIRKQIETSLKEVDMEKIRREMEEVKEEMAKHKMDFKVDMEKAREGIQKAKEELNGYQQMVDEMENEGLLQSGKDYTIEYKEGQLFLNGVKQSDGTTSKYKKYFKSDKITIRKKNGEMNINIQ